MLPNRDGLFFCTLRNADPMLMWHYLAVRKVVARRGVFRINLDQCAFGAELAGWGIFRKRTSLLTNVPELCGAVALARFIAE